MARPKKNKEIGAESYIGVRVTTDLRDAFERIALASGRSITDEAREALEVYARRRNAARK